MRRFVAVKEADGTWTVLDSIFGLPAEVEGRLAVGLSVDDAVRAAAKANAVTLRWRPDTAAARLRPIEGFGQAA